MEVPEALTLMTSSKNYFEYDDKVAIRRGNKGYQFGLVKDSPAILDYLSSEEKSKKLLVAWLHGKEVLIPDKKLTLVDRTLSKRDLVLRQNLTNNKEVEIGYVVDVELRTHLKILENEKTNRYIYNVDSKKLQPINKWNDFGGEVVYGFWRGKVVNSNVDVELIFSDGARCKVDIWDLDVLETFSDHKNRNGNFNDDIYPGQKLVGYICDFYRAKWIKSTKLHCFKTANSDKSHNQLTVTVDKISVNSLEIDWMHYDGTRKKDSLAKPKLGDFKGKAIEKLKILDPEYGSGHSSFVDIGDRLMYKISKDDRIETIPAGKMFDAKTKTAKVKDTSNESSLLNIPVTRSKTQSMEKSLNEKTHKKDSSSKSDLVPVEVEFTTSFINVMWQNGTIEENIHSVKLVPIGPDTDTFDFFFPGYYVLPMDKSLKNADYGVVVSANNIAKTCIVNWFQTYDNEDDSKKTEPILVERNSEMSCYSLKKHAKFGFDIGQRVVNSKEKSQKTESIYKKFGIIQKLDPRGYLIVKWCDGSISSSFPQDVLKASTTNLIGFYSLFKNEYLDDIDNSFEEDEASDFEINESEDEMNPCDFVEEGVTRQTLDVSELLSNKLSSPENLEKFQYQAELNLTHHYANSLPLGSGITKNFKTAISKEIKLFQTSLPEGIFVKGFEDRLDLYSAMIEGPKGTPYEDALFFFDISLPSNYPHSPPRFHYLSFCSDRLNPNLYEDGKVCISLLGTWDGEGSELWNSKSSILQVLISIQALILNSEPYFNEPGFEKQKGSMQGQRSSRHYNEVTVLKTLQSVVNQSQRPPFIFKKEVETFIAIHGLKMIERLESWISLSLTNKTVECEATTNIQNEKSIDPSVLIPTTKDDTSAELSKNEDICSENKIKGKKRGRGSSSSSNLSAKKLKTSHDNVKDDPMQKPSTSHSGSVDGSDDSSHIETTDKSEPTFPLLPMSRGCCLGLEDQIKKLKKSIDVLRKTK